MTCSVYIWGTGKWSSVSSLWRRSSVNRLDHHLNCLQGVRPASVFGPENSILVLASVMASSIPHSIEVRVCTGVVPPTSFVKVGTVSCGRNRHCRSSRPHTALCTCQVCCLLHLCPSRFSSPLTSLGSPYSLHFMPTLYIYIRSYFLYNRVDKIQWFCVRDIQKKRTERWQDWLREIDGRAWEKTEV